MSKETCPVQIAWLGGWVSAGRCRFDFIELAKYARLAKRIQVIFK